MIRVLQMIARLAGFLVLGVGMYYIVTTEAQFAKGDWFHSPSLIFISSALLGVMFCSFQVSKLWAMFKSLFFESPSRLEDQMKRLNSELKGLSEAYYRSGAKGLGEFMKSRHCPRVWRTVLSQLEARMPPDDIKALLRYDAGRFESEINSQVSVLGTLAMLAPSIGVLGTVFGLIRLLAELNDVTRLGPHMSLALITTLYGIFFSALIFHPLAARLKSVKEVRLKTYQQAIFWVSLIGEKKPAFYCDPQFYLQEQGK